MRKTLAAALFAAALIPARPAQALANQELLALVAMPLAIAAVSEVTDVPMNELMDVVSLMNDAAVPPAQFIEVVRYAPVALVVETENQPRFGEYVRLQYDKGLRGSELVNSIEDHMQAYDIHGVDFDVTAPRVVDVDEKFIPAVVTTRIAEARAHPHGGPPGQRKKQLGAKTGAEVVHGARDRATPRLAREERRKDDGPVVSDHRGRGKAKQVARGNGKGKGKGKDNG